MAVLWGAKGSFDRSPFPPQTPFWHRWNNTFLRSSYLPWINGVVLSLVNSGNLDPFCQSACSRLDEDFGVLEHAHYYTGRWKNSRAAFARRPQSLAKEEPPSASWVCETVLNIWIIESHTKSSWGYRNGNNSRNFALFCYFVVTLFYFRIKVRYTPKKTGSDTANFHYGLVGSDDFFVSFAPNVQ